VFLGHTCWQLFVLKNRELQFNTASVVFWGHTYMLVVGGNPKYIIGIFLEIISRNHWDISRDSISRNHLGICKDHF
jgi:hypothetical protein